jgi:hypothetical protein
MQNQMRDSFLLHYTQRNSKMGKLELIFQDISQI